MNKKSYPHAVPTDELFYNLNQNLLRAGWVKTHYKDRKKLAIKIFDDFLYELFDDIIENNVTFVAPSIKGDYADISVKPVTGEQFIDVRRRGGFKKVDYMKSGFTANMLSYNYSTSPGGTDMKNKPIYIDRILAQKLLDYTEQGKQYY